MGQNKRTIKVTPRLIAPAKPTGIKLTGNAKLWLVASHVITAAVWFGAALAMVAIGLFGNQTLSGETASGDAVYTVQALLAYLNDFLLMPAAALAILSGTALCAFTIWGFFKHYWVIAKWIGTVTVISAVSGWVGPWTYAATDIANEQRLQALQNPMFLFDQKAAVIGGVLEAVALLFLIIISFLKPWGRRAIAQASSKT